MTTILPNLLRISSEKLRHLLQQKYAVTLTALGWYPTAYTSQAETGFFTAMDEFASGLFYIQNPSSLVPVIALDPQPNEKILDLCAAPGGKTIHLAILMKNTGVIIANDVSRSRVARMTRLFKSYGITNARITIQPGQRLWQRWEGEFDRVLVDAPCSMCGTNTPSRDNVKKLTKQQRWLLRSALSACRPGGTIVYSTCTDHVEENEQVIAWLLCKDGKKVKTVDFDIPGCPLTAADTHTITDESTVKSVQRSRRIKKDREYEGFFITKLVRTVEKDSHTRTS
jgi:NOL1/NOP2/sun family putative RNA methylase